MNPVPAAFDVAVFGEAMLMFVADRPGPIEQAETFHKRTAGAETNVAIGLSRLGLQVGWASRLGTDSMGRYLIDAMRRLVVSHAAWAPNHGHTARRTKLSVATSVWATEPSEREGRGTSATATVATPAAASCSSTAGGPMSLSPSTSVGACESSPSAERLRT